jgi:hypothetical protein
MKDIVQIYRRMQDQGEPELVLNLEKNIFTAQNKLQETETRASFLFPFFARAGI